MKYRVTIEGREREVDVTLSPGGSAVVTLDGAPTAADIVQVPGGVSLRLGARVFDLTIGGTTAALDVAAGARRARAEVVSERALAKAKKGGAKGAGGDELRAPMPGRIVAIHVAAGQQIAQGAPCVVIEAMKMENELRAPRAGVVASIHVEVGASVEGRALLLKLEAHRT